MEENSRWASRRAQFKKMHEAGCFVLPNPWDEGTTRYLEGLGFRALATTSGGAAFSLGLPDSERAISRDLMLRQIRRIVEATSLPVNADFQSGYASDADGVAQNVKLCVQTGVSGLSIEDATGVAANPLYEVETAVERIRAAREAINQSGTGVLLAGRAECFLTGHSTPLKEAIRRLERYAEAGADVLYAPGAQSPEDIQAIVKAVSPKPVNVLMSSNNGLSVGNLAEMGVRRISVGSSLARAAWHGFIEAAREIARAGTFGGFDGVISYGELNTFFEREFQKQES